MKIRFTKHAKVRCILRKIPQQWVEDQLRSIPIEPGEHVKQLDGTRLTVVYVDGDEVRKVITLYGGGETNSLHRAWNLAKKTQVREMTDKAVGKSKQRGKRDKTKKRW